MYRTIGLFPARPFGSQSKVERAREQRLEQQARASKAVVITIDYLEP